MALVKKNSSVGHATSTSLSWSHPIDAASNLILVAISHEDTTGPTSVTVGGEATTFVNTTRTGADGRTSTYKLVNPPTGNQTITASFAGSKNIIGGATDYAGADTTTLGATSVSNNDGSSSRGITLNVQKVGSILFLAVGGGGSTIDSINEDSGTQEWFYDFGGNALKGEGASKTTLATGNQTITFSTSPANSIWWVICGIEVLEGASGPANVKTIVGLAKASVKTKNGLVIGSIKTVNGLN